MKLTLRIENYDYLPDGGPLEFSASARGFEVGRDSAMDWTLPDPNRHISSRHFEVVYRDRQFWLNDISTNGTFVYGQSMRVSSPLHLSHNERLQVGHYIIRVLIEEPAAQAPAAFAPQPFAPAFAAPQPPAAAADPWSLTPTPAPMPTPMPAPQRPAMPLAGQYGDSFVENIRPAPAIQPAQSGAIGLGGAAAPSEPFAQRPTTPPPPQATPPQAPGAPPAASHPAPSPGRTCKQRRQRSVERDLSGCRSATRQPCRRGCRDLGAGHRTLSADCHRRIDGAFGRAGGCQAICEKFQPHDDRRDEQQPAEVQTQCHRGADHDVRAAPRQLSVGNRDVPAGL